MRLLDEIPGEVVENVSLSDLVTVRAGGRAARLFRPAHEDAVGEAIRRLRSEGLPFRVLGGGSNLLPPDGMLEDWVIQPNLLRDLDIRGSEVWAGAGVTTSKLVARCCFAGLSGLEVLAGVPGHVGGALAMNAGTRYGAMGRVVQRVRVRLADGSPADLFQDDLSFGYRHTELPPGSVVCGVLFRLTAGADPIELRNTVRRWRDEKQASQPLRSWNFGCMFKNPEAGPSAGALLDRAGMKGRELGGARISPVHANFIENRGGASAEAIRQLIVEAEQVVMERHGVALEREVRIW